MSVSSTTPLPKSLTEPAFTENGRTIFDLRYPRKDENGNPSETPLETIWRVATNVAVVNTLYGDYGEAEAVKPGADPDRFPLRSAQRAHDWLVENNFIEGVGLEWFYDEKRWVSQAKKYAELLASLKFLPNSPTWTGAGTPLGNLSACFVLPVADDLGRGRDSIFETLKVAALIQQTGGGNGFDFSALRPKGAIVKKSMGRSSGPVSFMKVYDAAFKSLQQGGSRRGANMGVMRVDHPDLEEFLDAKIVEGELDQFNISVAITDAFMDAVEKDSDFDLVFDGEVYKTVRAKDIWERLINSAWKLGDPGVVFIDKMNDARPCPDRYEIVATNPCGEQPLPPYGSCNLGSIAVQRFIDPLWGEFDWAEFDATVRLAANFLDDVVDANGFVNGVPELADQAMSERRIGLGIMGLADALAMMGLAYDSDDGQDFVDRLFEHLRYNAMRASIDRAKRRGPFPWFKGSIYDGDWVPPVSLATGGRTLDWEPLLKDLKKYGIRNATTLTVAPTGTISNVAGCEGSGCEPIFALAYKRTVMQEEENIELTYSSPLFEKALASFGDPEWVRVQLDKVAANGGSCQGVESVPEYIRDIYRVAADISPTAHVYLQGICQAWVDSAISKTINAPNSATVEDVGAIYKRAYDDGCKGVTVYRQGSRELEVLSTKVDDVITTVIDEDHWPLLTPQALPSYMATEGLPTRTFEIQTAFGPMQVYITELRDHPGRPYDVRLQVGKAGNDKTADVEAIGRMASIALRTGVSVAAVVDQLEGIGGQSFVGFGPNRVRSAGDGLGKLLRRLYLDSVDSPPIDDEYIDQMTQANGTCPECKNDTVVYDSGCAHCEIRLGGCGVYSACD